MTLKFDFQQNEVSFFFFLSHLSALSCIRTCGKESALTERRLWAEREASAEKHMRDWGVEVTTLSAAEKARFRAAVEPMYAAFEEQSRLIQRIREA